ncbi:hypothetical protein [Helicobacter sp. 13S00477-4]|uniref:hypothetical protein n=1 Tax=Helicobacter sp. 13S00477-4 TaxID=1905759 RepID=UPI000BA5E98B|nr:hypothetical protein [Helicobacter sp. 13S00477-4]PAF52321.1 hypothetical protein BKH44_03170 [Helicobacter sp. 13S00477-4]
MKPNLSKIIYIIYLSIACGIFIGGVYFYQKYQENHKKITKTITKPLKSTPKIKPSLKIHFDPKIPKPTYYMGNIQGTLTYQHSLRIAQEYYDKGAYENAIIWSYRANQINPNDINSWKIYTASLAKLGKEKEASDLMQKAQNHFKKKTK